MPSENDVRRLLMGIAARAGRVGVRAGLAALDSALGDVQHTARDIERRVARGRRKAQAMIDDLLNPLRAQPQHDERNEEDDEEE